jgi:predicted Fe-Mo cluster-binding NifX family protein
MNIAIAASENHLNAAIDPHFGRCPWFCLFDTITRKSEFYKNPVCHLPEKAGCDAAAFLIEKGVALVIAGRFGSRVSEVFRTHNIQMVVPAKNITLQQIINYIYKQS